MFCIRSYPIYLHRFGFLHFESSISKRRDDRTVNEHEGYSASTVEQSKELPAVE